MTQRPPTRDRETRELIRRFEARRARRRRFRLLLASLVVIALVALVSAVVVLATRDPGPQEALGSTTVGALGEATTATATSDPVSTSEDPATAGSEPGASDTTDTTGEAPTTSAPATTEPPTTESTTTTSQPPATTASTPPPTSGAPAAGGLVVVIDPGHQGQGDSSLEPIGPGSDKQKAKVSSGTAGVVTGTPESELVLEISLKLRDSLQSHGITVVMTRTTQNVNISNIQRAQIANQAGADLFVRMHADGNSDPDVHGIHVLYPASTPGWTDDIAAESKRAATLAQQALIAATGAKDRGINPRSDMTGFNWADVPVILPEIGFMTNPEEDRLLATAAYQDKIVQALTGAILSYLGVG